MVETFLAGKTNFAVLLRNASEAAADEFLVCADSVQAIFTKKFEQVF